MRDLPTATTRTAVSVHDPKIATPAWRATQDDIVTEVPVALVYNCISHAVMMTSPVDLIDFAYGFSLSEQIIASVDDIEDVVVIPNDLGVTLRVQISAECFERLDQRRNMVGQTGCGLCGVENLKQAIRPVPAVSAPELEDNVIQQALSALRQHQPINAETGATHAAAWCNLQGEILVCREDVGRHNALDKLIGHLKRQSGQLSDGFVLVSSRASYEMVQKTAQAGIGALVAVSAPTSLAVAQAREAGLLLIGFARPGRHVIYHQPADAAPQTTPKTLSGR